MNIKEYESKPFANFAQGLVLVTAGKEKHFNAMTIGWGSMGTLWRKPVVTVFVKPCRYTFNFMQESDYFTVSFFDEKYQNDLKIMGTKSGRDGYKLSLTSLHPIYLEKGISYREAKQTFVLKKIYTSKLDKEMPKEIVDLFYSQEEEHYMYVGEVVEII